MNRSRQCLGRRLRLRVSQSIPRQAQQLQLLQHEKGSQHRRHYHSQRRIRVEQPRSQRPLCEQELPKPIHQSQQQRFKSSSSVLSNLARYWGDSVKSSLLDAAATEDSSLWKNDNANKRDALNGEHSEQNVNLNVNGSATLNGSHMAAASASTGTTPILSTLRAAQLLTAPPNNNNYNSHFHGSVDEPLGHLHDSLDDLYMTKSADAADIDGKGYLSNVMDKVVRPYQDADPFGLAASELDQLAASIRHDLIGTDHPVLHKAAAYFFEATADGGKKIRPMMVLLLSRALSNSLGSLTNTITKSTTTSQSGSLLTVPFSGQRPDLPQAQRRLAEISEMIHTASLFHDDVIDGSDTRRGMPSVHAVFGNKMAILAGDYLLARASISLARLRNVAVVETMSTIIEHLVRGEVMQLKGTKITTSDSTTDNAVIQRERLTYYLKKNYYKTASLMAYSCQSAALLGDYPAEWVDASYKYGKHMGMAFQLVDDILDFEGNLLQLGKPALADLKAGLATAPVLFAAEEYPDELIPLMERKFEQSGDVEQAVECVFQSSGLQRTKELAWHHAEQAIRAIVVLEESQHRDALIHLANKVVARTK